MHDPASFALFRAKARGEAPSNAARARARGAGLARAELAALPEPELWGALRAGGAAAPGEEEATRLELVAELAARLLGPSCRVCLLRCPVDRRRGERGACGLGAGLRPYQDFVHLGEELELIPTHAVYLAGCNYRCAYCSDWTHVVTPEQHAEVEPARLARSIEARRRAGALSLSLVGGVPDVSLPAIAAALVEAEVSTPLVWNTNLSATDEAQELLTELVDGYVADLKYGNEACSVAGSALKGALARTQELLRRVAGEAYLVVRHLLLPGHLACCTLPALDWLAAALPGARLNLMPQYLAPAQVRGTEWDRRPAADELDRARSRATALGFDLGGPGRIEAADLQVSEGGAEDAAAGFSSEITIGPDGRVVVENLSPELMGLLEALGAEGLEHEARRAAAAPWRPRPLPRAEDLGAEELGAPDKGSS
ncbi:MAG: radical SAM protein [Planctomycetota bacterium]